MHNQEWEWNGSDCDNDDVVYQEENRNSIACSGEEEERENLNERFPVTSRPPFTHIHKKWKAKLKG